MIVYIAQLWLGSEAEGELRVFTKREDAEAFLEAEHKKFKGLYGDEFEDALYHVVREEEVR